MFDSEHDKESIRWMVDTLRTGRQRAGPAMLAVAHSVPHSVAHSVAQVTAVPAVAQVTASAALGTRNPALQIRVSNHEGRHRMAAWKRLRCANIPILLGLDSALRAHLRQVLAELGVRRMTATRDFYVFAQPNQDEERAFIMRDAPVAVLQLSVTQADRNGEAVYFATGHLRPLTNTESLRPLTKPEPSAAGTAPAAAESANRPEPEPRAPKASKAATKAAVSGRAAASKAASGRAASSQTAVAEVSEKRRKRKQSSTHASRTTTSDKLARFGKSSGSGKQNTKVSAKTKASSKVSWKHWSESAAMF